MAIALQKLKGGSDNWRQHHRSGCVECRLQRIPALPCADLSKTIRLHASRVLDCIFLCDCRRSHFRSEQNQKASRGFHPFFR